MGRVTVWVPDELDAAARAALPDLNWSAVLQAGLRDRLDCRHDHLACAHCAAQVDRLEVQRAAKTDLFLDTMARVGELARRVGTAEGAARVALDVARRHQLPAALAYTLPRPTRAGRQARRVVDLADEEAGSRRRHPTARPAQAAADTPLPPVSAAAPTTTTRRTA